MQELKLNTDDEQREAALDICSIIREKGGRALAVGGCVRDAMLGKICKDIDLECYGITAQDIIDAVSPKYPLELVGASFGVMKVHHLDIDIALPRVENKTGAGHRGFMVNCIPNLSFSEAAARRDFTINAMMLDLLTGELIDPWNGEQDLKAGIIRHVSEHFSEDPLRVLRAMQFTARFGFEIAQQTIELCRNISQEELPMERLSTEWEKMLLKGMHISKGLQFLRDCGWIGYYPELQCLIGCEQTPLWHPEGDVWNHTLLCVDAAAKRRVGNENDDLVLMLAALCHDLGKPATTFTREDGYITSPGHDEAGKEPTLSFISRLWNRNDLPERVLPLVLNHMKPAQFLAGNAKDKAYRRLALAVGRLDLLVKLCECDIEATSLKVSQRLDELNAFKSKAESLDIQDEAPHAILQGRHLIALGIKPGPHMGKLLKEAFEAQLDGLFRTEDEAIEYARKYLLTDKG